MRRGEIVGYAGPNGAGKSTTIKLLAGILGPDTGAVRINGLDPLADRRHHVGRIGVVFGQRTELWHDHPVRASFEWKRVVWDIPPDRYRRMLGELSELLELGELLGALARELSLGQRMRAELAMALLHEPDLLLLDEPTIGLDVLGKRRILAFVKALRERGHGGGHQPRHVGPRAAGRTDRHGRPGPCRLRRRLRHPPSTGVQPPPAHPGDLRAGT